MSKDLGRFRGEKFPNWPDVALAIESFTAYFPNLYVHEERLEAKLTMDKKR